MRVPFPVAMTLGALTAASEPWCRFTVWRKIDRLYSGPSFTLKRAKSVALLQFVDGASTYVDRPTTTDW